LKFADDPTSMAKGTDLFAFVFIPYNDYVFCTGIPVEEIFTLMYILGDSAISKIKYINKTLINHFAKYEKDAWTFARMLNIKADSAIQVFKLQRAQYLKQERQQVADAAAGGLMDEAVVTSDAVCSPKIGETMKSVSGEIVSSFCQDGECSVGTNNQSQIDGLERDNDVCDAIQKPADVSNADDVNAADYAGDACSRAVVSSSQASIIQPLNNLFVMDKNCVDMMSQMRTDAEKSAEALKNIVQVTRERIDLEASARKKKMDEDETAHHADIIRLKTKTQAEVDAMTLKKKAETDADIESMRRKKMAELQVTLEYEKELESMRETKKHKTQSQQPLSAGDNSHGFICTRDVFEKYQDEFPLLPRKHVEDFIKKAGGKIKMEFDVQKDPSWPSSYSKQYGSEGLSKRYYPIAFENGMRLIMTKYYKDLVAMMRNKRSSFAGCVPTTTTPTQMHVSELPPSLG